MNARDGGGVAGFGGTPEAAAQDFDKNWYGQKLAAIAAVVPTKGDAT